jgi:hypothetical protein
LKLKEKDIRDKDLIAILRDDEDIQIIHERKKCRYFDWANEIE